MNPAAMPLRVWIGHDRNETVAAQVLAHSIWRRATAPVLISMLRLEQLPMTRERDPKQSTDFAFSRFLVPYLCGFKGYSLFLDGDMLCRGDVTSLFAAIYAQPRASVCVVKHDYQPREGSKFLGQHQTVYEKKNWSSVMLFDNAKCAALTPEYVNTASGLELHQFKWLGGEYHIGALGKEWNCLIGEDNQCALDDAKMLHFTKGTPCFAAYAHCPGSGEWRAERQAMLYYNPINEYSLPERDAA